MAGAARDVSPEIIADARSLSPSAFCTKHPYPFLVGEARSGNASLTETQFMTTAVPVVHQVPDPMAVFPSGIFPIRKAPENPFAAMVMIGRAPNNDLHLEVQTISKFHAYFSNAEGKWRLTDGRSQNGTFVQGERLGYGGERVINDGDAIAFGPDSRFRYFESRTLYHMIRGFVDPTKNT